MQSMGKHMGFGVAPVYHLAIIPNMSVTIVKRHDIHFVPPLGLVDA
jgi:hypothetical protein